VRLGMKSLDNSDKVKELLLIIEKLNQVKDLDSLLDQILLESRKFTHADAGSIFLIKDNVLEFSYVQNDTMAKHDPANHKYIYSYLTVPINKSSICGYVALTGKALMLDNVYNLPKEVPYSFNPTFDNVSKYQTCSVLTIPLITSIGEIIGVIQIINAKDAHGDIIPFKEDDQTYVSFFANHATVAIERAKMTREIILRMIKMAEFRDPKETGTHVNRVGAYAIEIYHRWALKKGITEEEIKRQKDILRIAAMLHDVGKIAVSDAILKKSTELSAAEFENIKKHTEWGANLFADSVSEMDKLSALIALTHHEKWDGTGYPAQLKETEIPLAGRIVALADVYDALASKRVYKDTWDEHEILTYINEQCGKHFDPEVVSAFIEIYDIIQAIRGRYLDPQSVTQNANDTRSQSS
jgi:HD-GYP domain-containing protein (c-di-GMP phosphodiesterase class II)